MAKGLMSFKLNTVKCADCGQTFNVVEGLSVGKNTNDLLIYIITCIFVLLLIDYIFKMGKNSY